MLQEIVISGFGGQGVLFAGQLLAYAGVAENRYVTWIPSYGPEMRGGTAHCTVIISDEEIGSPLVQHPTAAIVMNSPSLERYSPLIKPDGLLIVDSSLIPQRSSRTDIHEIALPARDIAAGLGLPQIANVVMLGALLGATGVLQFETMEQILEQHLSHRHRAALEPNKQALRAGAQFAQEKAFA